MPARSWRRAAAENAALVVGVFSVGAVLIPVLLGYPPNAAEVIIWAGCTIVLLIALRVYQRTNAFLRDRVIAQLTAMHGTRQCSACEFTGDWFTVLMHEGAVHKL